jgi:parallel beta-helix repeat protein
MSGERMHPITVRKPLPRRRGLLLALVAVLVMAMYLVSAGSANAGHVTCGQVITTDTTLDGDVGPCNGTDGIVIGADAITLDLNGHSVIGDTNLDGEGAVGIAIQNRENVTITSSKDGGTVRDFDAGVAIIRDSRSNTVRHLVVRDNIGNSTVSDFGDGIVVFNSSDNVIDSNIVDHNGPFDGIGVVESGGGVAERNTIENNTVVNNNIPSSPTINQDDGIRLEPDTANNTVIGNTVANNGLDGIALFAGSEDGSIQGTTDNTLRNNNVYDNGFHDKAHRKGDGVRLFTHGDNASAGANNNAVEDGTIHDNAANGIRVDSRSNEIEGNATSGNAQAATIHHEVKPLTVRLDHRVHLQVAGEEVQDPAPAYDLHDGNGSCEFNTWTNNTFDTAFPDCID